MFTTIMATHATPVTTLAMFKNFVIVTQSAQSGHATRKSIELSSIHLVRVGSPPAFCYESLHLWQLLVQLPLSHQDHTTSRTSDVPFYPPSVDLRRRLFTPNAGGAVHPAVKLTKRRALRFPARGGREYIAGIWGVIHKTMFIVVTGNSGCPVYIWYL